MTADTNVLNAFRYPLKSPAAKTLSADMMDCSPPSTPGQTIHPTVSAKLNDSIWNANVEAGDVSVTEACAESSNMPEDLEMSRAGGDSAVVNAESDSGQDRNKEEAHNSDASHISEDDDRESVYNEAADDNTNTAAAYGDAVTRSPGCDTSAEANSEASPSGREETMPVRTCPPIQETSQEGSPSHHDKSNVSDTNHISPAGQKHTAVWVQPRESPLVQAATPQGKGGSTYISPPWTNGSNPCPGTSAAKAMHSTDSNTQNSYLVSPAMHSLEYSGASSVSTAWTTQKKTGMVANRCIP